MSGPATRLSAALADRYRIERELGAGGMATVYLARDLRHDRDVAVKVLHPDLAAALGTDRFLAEIKTTAKLQHPHILPLLDSGAADGFLFYVMPFVSGESLRDRLTREKQLPIEDALRVAREVADALGAAHAVGVVHRDVKPENILLQGGHALVADFGIALAVQQAGGTRMTQTGLSLGTPQYMSPEQAMGERAIDHRSDLYSLGAVTYEMLTGDPPFTGSTVQAVVAKTLTERPTPPRSVRDTIPVNVEAAVLRALAKLPADRFATASSFVAALESQSTSAVPVAIRPRSRLTTYAPWALLAVSLALLLPGRLRPGNGTGAEPMLRALLPLDLREVSSSSIVISPDARYVAYIVGSRQSGMLRLMSLATGEHVAFSGGETGGAPFFSPDSRWLGFFSGTSLRRVPVSGGRAEDVAPVSTNTFRTASWATPDQIIVSDGVMRRVVVGGGIDTIRIAGDSVLRRCIWPLASPDGRFLVCNRGGPLGREDDILHIVQLESGSIESTGLDGVEPIAFRFDHLIYRRGEDVVMAVPVDMKSGRVTGEPFQLLGQATFFTLADNGTAVFTEADPQRRLVLRAGDSTRTVWTPPWPIETPRFSPNGQSIAVRRADNGTIWLYDIPTGTSTQLADTGASPAWSKDGRFVAYLIPTPGMQPRHVIRRRRADLSAPEEQLLRLDSVRLGAFDLASDGRTVAFHSGVTNAVWTMTPGLGTPPVAFTGSGEYAVHPRFSPDGRWLAYVVQESGERTVVVRPTAGGGRITISDGAGLEPVWAPNGRALFYRRNNDYVRADLSLSPVLRVTNRSTLLRTAVASADGLTYDVAPDGQRLLLAEPVTGGQVVIVVNWIEELRQRLDR
jgi:serine/threonine protein kinase/Tol biopolymer transport system component